MILINLWGAPASGKSTGAAALFSMMKMQDLNVELVAEFAKDKTWEENWMAIKNQAYVFGEQYHRIYRLQDKVDYIVTDSPIPLSIIYNTNPALGEHFEQMIWDVFHSFETWNYLLFRPNRAIYHVNGRKESEEEAGKLHLAISNLMVSNSIDFLAAPCTTEGFNKIIADVFRRIQSK